MTVPVGLDTAADVQRVDLGDTQRTKRPAILPDHIRRVAAGAGDNRYDTGLVEFHRPAEDLLAPAAIFSAAHKDEKTPFGSTLFHLTLDFKEPDGLRFLQFLRKPLIYL